jgi:hypothetical protein
MTVRPTARSLLPALLAAGVVAGCGPTPPQAPLHQAAKIDAATSDISTECGLAYQVTAFPGDHHKELANLEANALESVHTLASVYHGNPAWIYQGETVGQIVVDAVTMLKACGLGRAASALEDATGQHV